MFQLFHAGPLVDSVRQYQKQDVLDAVTEVKRLEQEQATKAQLARLGIEKLEAILTTFPELFGCADWKVQVEAKGVRAETKSCLACGIAKKLGSASPFAIFCIFEMSAGL